MSLVFDQPSGGPSTHAIVLGVGAYAHLPGGTGTLYPGHEHMAQLSSPPHSARAFATWLLTRYRNPDKPLATLDLYISEAGNTTFTDPGGNVLPVESAGMAQVRQAVRDWKARGDDSSDHLMIFFFCGHGVASGTETSLLLEDFGSYADDPLENAIDLGGLWLGMDKCVARQQCYFIDACRIAPDSLIYSYEKTGQAIIVGSAPLSTDRHAPIYYSTVAGSQAYGLPGAPSVFTTALVKALEGAGSDNFEGDWRVYTNRLNVGIDHLLERAGTPLVQVNPTDHLTRFTIHHIEGKPIVPVTVTCDPDRANATAELSYYPTGTAGQVPRPTPAKEPWDLDVEEGRYRFDASFTGGPYHASHAERDVRPAYQLVRIEVGQ